MDIESFRAYCLAKPAVTEDFPFDPHTLVFRVMNKIFVFVALDETPLRIAMKCDPERVIELRQQYSAITSGAYLNKNLWNSITLNGSVPPALLLELADLSYNLVVKGLTKKQQKELAELATKS